MTAKEYLAILHIMGVRVKEEPLGKENPHSYWRWNANQAGRSTHVPGYSWQADTLKDLYEEIITDFDGEDM